MANRRMFSLSIVDSDDFLSMPVSARELYFQLGMRADDDGFIQPLRIIRMIGATSDDLQVLASKNFIIPFESGVVIIRHWKENNYLRSDRYNETIFKNERALLSLDNNGFYCLDTIGIPKVNQVSYQRDTQVRLGKDRKGNNINNPGDKRQGDQFQLFVISFNEITGREFKFTNDKAKRQLISRLEEGYKMEDLLVATKNCKSDPFHVTNPQYLTPEFITRQDKLEKYLHYMRPKSSGPSNVHFANGSSDYYSKSIKEAQQKGGF